MSLELFIAIAAFFLGAGSLGYSLWRPNINAEKILALQEQMQELRDEHDALQTRYQKLFNENLRLSTLNIWFQQQLLKAGIELPPIPDWLRPHSDDGDVTVVINRNRSQGGVNMSGGQMDVKGDLTGGDKTQGEK